MVYGSWISISKIVDGRVTGKGSVENEGDTEGRLILGVENG